MAINTTGANTAQSDTFYQTQNPSENLTDYPVEIRAKIYSDMVMELIQDDFLSEGISRNVSEFNDGARIVIPQIGEVTVSDIAEGSTANSQTLGTSEIALTIQNYKGSTLGITDVMKQDSYLASTMEAAFPRKMLRALNEEFERDLFAQEAKQVAATSAFEGGAYGTGGTSGASCIINGVPHRFAASGSGVTISQADFVSAKLSMDKANIPSEGRIAIVDPVVEATLNTLLGNAAFSAEPHYGYLMETGFARNMKFLGNFMGFDIYTSNRLNSIDAGEAIGTFSDVKDGTVSTNVNNGNLVANLFLSVYDEETMPFMHAWRESPNIEGDRVVSEKTDYFYSSARWGAGIQRPEALVVIATDASNY